MRFLTIISIAALLTACTPDPAKVESVATAEASRLAAPSQPLSSFSRFELAPMTFSPEILNEEGKMREAREFEIAYRTRIRGLLDQWNTNVQGGARDTLVVEADLVRLRIISGGARFWAGAFAGDSFLDLNLRLVNKYTGERISNIRVYKDADAMGGAWSIGQTDQNLDLYVIEIIHTYLSENYQQVAANLDGESKKGSATAITATETAENVEATQVSRQNATSASPEAQHRSLRIAVLPFAERRTGTAFTPPGELTHFTHELVGSHDDLELAYSYYLPEFETNAHIQPSSLWSDHAVTKVPQDSKIYATGKKLQADIALMYFYKSKTSGWYSMNLFYLDVYIFDINKRRRIELKADERTYKKMVGQALKDVIRDRGT